MSDLASTVTQSSIQPSTEPTPVPTRARRTRWQLDENTTSTATLQNPSSLPITDPSNTTIVSLPTGQTRQSRWTTAQRELELEILKDLRADNALQILSAAVQPTAKEKTTLSIPSNITLSYEQKRTLAIMHHHIEDLYLRVGNPSAYLEKIPVRDRSPSPVPTYGDNGERNNTREQRFQKLCTQRRNQLIQRIQEILPLYNPPGYKKERPFRKVPIPVDEHPTYNFSGLIIGPRGTTHQKMESDFNCKISVRGKLPNDFKAKQNEFSHEPAHVFIEGDNEENVIACAERMTQLLVVLPDSENQYKINQLVELSRFNGVLTNRVESNDKKMQNIRENQRKITNYNGPGVQCEYCGSTSHVSLDCRRKNQTLEMEYDKMEVANMIGAQFLNDDDDDGPYDHAPLDLTTNRNVSPDENGPKLIRAPQRPKRHANDQNNGMMMDQNQNMHNMGPGFDPNMMGPGGLDNNGIFMDMGQNNSGFKHNNGNFRGRHGNNNQFFPNMGNNGPNPLDFHGNMRFNGPLGLNGPNFNGNMNNNNMMPPHPNQFMNNNLMNMGMQSNMFNQAMNMGEMMPPQPPMGNQNHNNMMNNRVSAADFQPPVPPVETEDFLPPAPPGSDDPHMGTIRNMQKNTNNNNMSMNCNFNNNMMNTNSPMNPMMANMNNMTPEMWYTMMYQQFCTTYIANFNKPPTTEEWYAYCQQSGMMQGQSGTPPPAPPPPRPQTQSGPKNSTLSAYLEQTK